LCADSNKKESSNDHDINNYGKNISIQLFFDDEHGLSVFHGLQQNSNDYIMHKESEL
jgi:hypothetical protein